MLTIELGGIVKHHILFENVKLEDLPLMIFAM